MAARRAERSWLSRGGAGRTAVVCANDLIALGLLQHALRNGLAVPEELAIVGYDDIEFASASAVPLTSVRQPSVNLGRRRRRTAHQRGRAAR